MDNLVDLDQTSGWLTIWSDIKQGGVPLFIFLALLLVFNIKKYIIDLFGLLFGKLSKTITGQALTYTKKDVIAHPIFKNLEFWLSVGIKSIRFNNIQSGLFKPRGHSDTEEYLKAKEDIAKDLLRIKFSTISSHIRTFLNEIDIDKLELSQLRQYSNDILTKCRIKQQNAMIEEGIPEEFLTKYLVFDRVSSQILTTSVSTFLEEKTCDLDVCTRLYIILNLIDSYLMDIFNNIVQTVYAINGDLVGIEYKGNIIGKKLTPILQPPHPTFKLIMNEKLNKILTEFKAKRCYVLKYFRNKDRVLMHSCVYETCDFGITEEISNLQNIPTIKEADLLKILNTGEVVAADISKFNNYLADRFSKRGIKAVIIAPIMSNKEMTGVLMLDYMNLDKFNEAVDITTIDKTISKYTKEISPYLVYPDDYNFD